MVSSSLRRLCRRADFVRAAKEGVSIAAKGIVLQRLPAEDGIYIGITATGKLGGAVVRNRVKRRLRALVREIFPAEAVNGHYVLIGRAATLDRPYDALRKDLRYALYQVKGHR